MSVEGEAFETFKKFLGHAVKGENMNGYSKAINVAGNNMFGGAEVVNRMLNKKSFGTAMGETFGKIGEDGARSFKNGSDIGKIAGSYIGASAAARVVTGGGLTRDNKGNPNLIGVPFV